MKNIMDFINGYKSYLFVTAGAIAYALFMTHILDEETFKWIAGICAAGYAASLRHAVDKAQTAASDQNV